MSETFATLLYLTHILHTKNTNVYALPPNGAERERERKQQQSLQCILCVLFECSVGRVGLYIEQFQAFIYSMSRYIRQRWRWCHAMSANVTASRIKLFGLMYRNPVTRFFPLQMLLPLLLLLSFGIIKGEGSR